MARTLIVEPTPAASTNPQGITFGATAVIEFKNIPERILNKEITGVALTKIDLTGLYVNKGPLSALIPWSSIVDLQY